MNYEHTQHGWWHRIFLVVAALMLVGAYLARSDGIVATVVVLVGCVFVVTAWIFGSLTVRDEGQWLALRYGPLPLVRKRIRYADITAVEPGRISIIDGWGIHYILGRGWTYNLWGFGCVKLTLGKKTIRVGSDDVEKLAEFLRKRSQLPLDADIRD